MSRRTAHRTTSSIDVAEYLRQAGWNPGHVYASSTHYPLDAFMDWASGGDIHATAAGETIGHLAATHGRFDILGAWLDLGGHVSARDQAGTTVVEQGMSSILTYATRAYECKVAIDWDDRVGIPPRMEAMRLYEQDKAVYQSGIRCMSRMLRAYPMILAEVIHPVHRHPSRRGNAVHQQVQKSLQSDVLGVVHDSMREQPSSHAAYVLIRAWMHHWKIATGRGPRGPTIFTTMSRKDLAPFRTPDGRSFTMGVMPWIAEQDPMAMAVVSGWL
jgi:hypothetical protein